MSENKFTSRQFLMSLLFVAFILGYLWADPNDISEGLQWKMALLSGAVVVMYCFNDLSKKLIEKIDMLKGMFGSKTEAPIDG